MNFKYYLNQSPIISFFLYPNLVTNNDQFKDVRDEEALRGSHGQQRHESTVRFYLHRCSGNRDSKRQLQLASIKCSKYYQNTNDLSWLNKTTMLIVFLMLQRNTLHYMQKYLLQYSAIGYFKQLLWLVFNFTEEKANYHPDIQGSKHLSQTQEDILKNLLGITLFGDHSTAFQVSKWKDLSIIF